MQSDPKTELSSISKQIRIRTIKTSHQARIPHLGSCLSCIDILTTLYFSVLNIDPKNPKDPNRDRFILSKGHGAPALFQVLAKRGFYPEENLKNYGENGSVFAEHPPAPNYLPGIEAATGSLGHGLPMGVGMALAAKVNDQNYKVHVVVSDGECNEGSIWEAALFAASQKLHNLCVTVDFNKWQATGRSCEVMPLDQLPQMWKAFGWEVIEVDGHNLEQLKEVYDQLSKSAEKPTAIIAHTTKGKGVSFMEDDNNWHYRIPTEEEVRLADRELFEGVCQ